MTNECSSTCSQLLAIEIFATAHHERQQFGIFSSNFHGRWRGHPHVWNEALKQRRRWERSRQRDVGEEKNRSDLMNNCAPPIWTLNIKWHALAPFTLSVTMTYSTVETKLPKGGHTRTDRCTARVQPPNSEGALGERIVPPYGF